MRKNSPRMCIDGVKRPFVRCHKPLFRQGRVLRSDHKLACRFFDGLTSQHPRKDAQILLPFLCAYVPSGAVDLVVVEYYYFT